MQVLLRLTHLLTRIPQGNPVIPFLILAFVFLLACVYLLLRGVWHGHLQQRVEQQQTNVEIARSRLQVITAARCDGEISEDEFETEKKLIEQQLANELSSDAPCAGAAPSRGGQWLGLAVVPFFVAGVIALYLKVGDTRALDADFVTSMTASDSSVRAAANGSSGASDPTAISGEDGKLPSIEELLPRLETHLETNPQDSQGWTLLGTTYMRLRRFKDAESALGKAAELVPDDNQVLLQLADAKAMLADGVIGDEAVSLIEKVLLTEPDNIQANWLIGMAAQQRGDSRTAVAAWEKLLPQVEADPQSSQQLKQMIAEARAQIGQGEGDAMEQPASSAPTKPETREPNEVTQTAEQADAAGIKVSVSLTSQLGAELEPATAVFIYARATQGPPMPLAVVKKTVADLPLTVVLDDSMAMMPQLTLSAFPSDNITVGARVSLHGDPIAKPGDLFGEQSGISPAATADDGLIGVSIEITQRVE